MTRQRNRTQLTTHVSPQLASEVIQLAASRGVSVSATVEVLLAEALRSDVEHNHAALLEAAVERTIRSSLAQHLNRQPDLLKAIVLPIASWLGRSNLPSRAMPWRSLTPA